MRGLTILEILIVLALLIAIGAMVAPSMVGVLEDRALDSAADVAQQQLVLARAHAQSSGRPVEVAYRAEPARVIARYFGAGERGIREGDRRSATLRGDDDLFAGSDGQRSGNAIDVDDDALRWNWAQRYLPHGVTITRNRPSDEMSRPLEDDHRFTVSASPDLPQSIRLAVFMPDGSALLATPVWLANERGRAVRLEVNVWTGLPRLGEYEESGPSREAAGGGHEESGRSREAASGGGFAP